MKFVELQKLPTDEKSRESREVYTLTINMAGEVMTPTSPQDADPSGRDGAG